MVSAALIIFMIVAIILLFVSMVTSAMAANEAHKNKSRCVSECHKYSMFSALISGISVAVMIVILTVYIYSSVIGKKSAKPIPNDGRITPLI